MNPLTPAAATAVAAPAAGRALSALRQVRADLPELLCLALLALVLWTHGQEYHPVGAEVTVVASSESQTAYDRSSGVVRAAGTVPALRLTLDQTGVRSLLVQMTAVDERIMPNYDMTELRLASPRGSAAEPPLRPVPSGRPDITRRQLLWQFPQPVDGTFVIYPPRDARFVIDAVSVDDSSRGVPTFLWVTAIVALYGVVRLARGSHPWPGAASASLVRGLWSVALVFWLALVAAHVTILAYAPRDQQMLQPYMIQDWPGFFVDETPERLLTAVFYAGGALAAIGGTLLLGWLRCAVAPLAWSLVAFVPLAAMAAAATMEPYRVQVEGGTVAVIAAPVPWLVVVGLVLGAGLFVALWSRQPAAPAGDVAEAGAAPAAWTHDWRDWVFYTVLLLAALPVDLTAAAARIGFETHILSFVIGPALYAAFGSELIPGRDFLSQYGVGVGPVFATFIGGSAEEALSRYLLLAALITWMFFALAYVVARRCLGSRVWATGIVTLGFFHHFHVSASGGGNMFDPSGWPFRFPLLPLFLLALVRAFAGAVGSLRHDARRFALAGGLLGASLFWNTETGIYMLITVVAASLVLLGASRRTAVALLTTAAALVLAFAAFTLAAFGAGAFSLDYVRGLYLPLVVYGGGWSARMIDWTGDWTVIYAVITPALAIATVAWALLRAWGRWSALAASEREQLAWLVTLSVVGLLLVVKFYNRSLNTLWWFNSLPLTIVSAFWVKRWWPPSPAARGVALLRGGLAGIAIAGYLFTLADPRPDNTGYEFGIRAWLRYPTLFAAGTASEGWHRLDSRVSPSVVSEIQRRVPPGERVALVSPRDWVYLLRAERAPMAHFLPHTELQLQYQLAASVEGAAVVFVEESPSGRALAADRKSLWRHLKPLLDAEYRRESVVDRMAVYVRNVDRP